MKFELNLTLSIGIITIRMDKYHLKNLYFATFDSRAPRLQVFSWSWYSAQSYACAFGLCAVLNSFLGSKFQFVFRRRCNIILYPKSKWHVCSHFHVSKLGKGDIRVLSSKTLKGTRQNIWPTYIIGRKIPTK